MERKKNQGIQLLRICACFAVFVVHFGQRMEFAGALRTVSDFGNYGTRLFFLISGFLAAKSIMGKQQFSIKEYYIKRAIRILPLYYAVILFFFTTETFVWREIPADPLKLGWFRYIFLLNGLVWDESYFWSNLGITWTIPVFCLFYLVIPWLMKIMKNLRSTVVVFVVSCIVSVLCLKYCNGYLIAVRKLSIFILGVLVYQLNTKTEKYLFASVATAGIIAMLIAQVKISYPIVVFLALLLLAVNNVKIDFSGRTEKIINVLDEHSYTLYLAQGIIFCGLIDKVWLLPKYRLIVIIVTTIMLTYLMHRFIEKPAQRILTKKLLKK